MHLGPSFGDDFGDLPVGHVGQAGEDVAQIGKRINGAPATVFDEGVNDGAALAGIGIADEEPVFLAQRRWPDGVFDKIRG